MLVHSDDGSIIYLTKTNKLTKRFRDWFVNDDSVRGSNNPANPSRTPTNKHNIPLYVFVAVVLVLTIAIIVTAV